MKTRLLHQALLAAAALIVLVNPAHAYIDPGSGSLFLQILVASLVGGWFGIKMYWSKIVAFFRKKSGDKQPSIDVSENRNKK
jgi:hypothetical protein